MLSIITIQYFHQMYIIIIIIIVILFYSAMIIITTNFIGNNLLPLHISGASY